MKKFLVHVAQVGNLRPIENRPAEGSVNLQLAAGYQPAPQNHLRWIVVLVCLILQPLHAETPMERGKRIVNECLDALGGDRFRHVENREQSGRAYSFYREQLTGLSIAKIYTHYYGNVTDTAHQLAQRERQNFGKKEDFGNLFGEQEAWDITFRGARPLPLDRFARYKETTIRDIFYILRVRFQEPGLTFESRGAAVLQNAPVEVVDITDADNRVTTVYFHQFTKLPLRQVFNRRDPVTKFKDEEIALFSKYRDTGNGVQWPFAIERERNGEKVFEIFSDSVIVNSPKVPDSLFALPSSIKLLKPQ